MKKVITYLLITFSAFFIINTNVFASKSSTGTYYMRIDEFNKYFMTDEQKNQINPDLKKWADDLISSIENDYYYYFVYRNGTFVYGYWKKSLNDYVLYFDFVYMDDKIYVSPYKLMNGYDIYVEQHTSTASYSKGWKRRSLGSLMHGYDINTKKLNINDGQYGFYATNCPVIQFTSEPNNSTTFPVNELYFEDDTQCYYPPATEMTNLFTDEEFFIKYHKFITLNLKDYTSLYLMPNTSWLDNEDKPDFNVKIEGAKQVYDYSVVGGWSSLEIAREEIINAEKTESKSYNLNIGFQKNRNYLLIIYPRSSGMDFFVTFDTQLYNYQLVNNEGNDVSLVDPLTNEEMNFPSIPKVEEDNMFYKMYHNVTDKFKIFGQFYNLYKLYFEYEFNDNQMPNIPQVDLSFLGINKKFDVIDLRFYNPYRSYVIDFMKLSLALYTLFKVVKIINTSFEGGTQQ